MRYFKKYSRRNQLPSRACSPYANNTSTDDRRGSVLLVVIGLLSMLLLAGIAFYTFASQEDSSANEFAEAAKENRNPTMEADALFNFALEQLIVGPESTLVHSALLGGRGANAGQLPWGRHSLIAGVLGSDTTPYNGFGVHLQSDATGLPYVDQDYNANGVSDVPDLLNILNFSAAANGGTAATVPLAPAVDTGVTSPDINSIYLSYTGTGMSGGSDVAVHIPSFHRPQYRLGSAWATTPTNWHSDTATATQVFRPHPNHVCANNPSRRRFLSAATTSPSGHLVPPFQFQPAGLNQGVWDLTAAPGGPVAQYQYDVDNTGSGVRDGVWMDLDHPVQELADGRRFVPLFSFTVQDADGLINLNVSGNRNGFAPAGALPLANGGNLSRSNMGLSRSEINPEWGMLADPTIDSGLTSTINNEYRVFWNLPTAMYPMANISRLELANRDWFHILSGRASFVTAPGSPLGTPNYRLDGADFQPRSYYFGKWEDPAHVLSNSMVPATSAAVNFGTLPMPGIRNNDDDGDVMAGRATYNSNYNLIPSMGHPFDPTGVGIGLQVGGTGLRSMRTAGTVSTFLSYYQYQGLSEYFANAAPSNEDANSNGRLDGVEDLNRNGTLDPGEDINGNGILDWGEDLNANYVLDFEDINGNGTLDNQVSVFPNYTQAGGGSLMLSPVAALIDEADESVAEPGLAVDNPATRADMLFNYDEEFGLHASNLDVSGTGFASRLRNLAPANFESSNIAALIRSQYCVSSFDRTQFTGGSNNARSSWEINYDFDQNGAMEFPPAVFSMAAPLQAFKLDPRDPIRTPMRHLLKSEVGGTAAANVVSQLRWNMNQFVSGYTNSGPIYRSLTPHHANPGNTVIPNLVAMLGGDGSPGRQGVDDDGNGFADFVDVDGDNMFTAGTDFYDYNEVGNSSSDDIQPTSAAGQEFWARRDRQQMARDIYVLLYLLGGGNDSVSYIGDNSARAIYSNAQLAEMAQFAVNYVDAMDRDNVITKFEYDRNLGNGWNLGDNPFETADDNIASGDRGVVYGVEAQQLTFSEVLGIISRRVEGATAGTYENHVATQVDDSEGAADRFYTFLELRNASPYPADLTYGSWQIAVQDLDPDGTPDTGDEVDKVQLTLLGGDTTNTIASGGLFTIGNRGGPQARDLLAPTQNLPSVFKVDPTADPAPDFTSANQATWIAPATPAVAATGAPDLDLIPVSYTADNTIKSSKFRLTKSTGLPSSTVVGAGNDENTPGNFLFGGPGGNVTDESAAVTFILRRRLHPYRTMPVSYTSSNPDHVAQSNDNPWVEVDRIVMPSWMIFQLSSGDGATEVQTALTALTSRERAHPFARPTAPANDPQHAAVAVAPYRSNSVGGQNTNSTLPFSTIQLHYDRDFTGPTDLFAIPLYGPRLVTTRGAYNSNFDESNTTALFAQERFLRPRHYDNTTTPPGNVNLDNRWYRLLEMMEVPTRTHATVTASNSPYNLRTPGRINLNTTRTRGVLAGLLDDWGLISDGAGGTTLGGAFNGGFATASYGGMLNDGDRDWWSQFLLSRDGADPLTSMVLPGMAHSRPFRGLNFLDQGTASIDDTVLRSVPVDGSSVTRRGLFEARTSTDLGSNLVDSSTRHRLLRKVMNNSTTRSNVFLVWVSVGYFEAIQHPNGDVQIGGPLAGAGTHRGFFVIDRSLPEKAFNPQSNEFDYQKFIQYRKTIQ